MQQSVYEVDARREQNHWWYVGRRRLFANVIRTMAIPTEQPVLDVGTSAGTNLRLLRDLGFTDVTGLDYSEEAIRFCAAKGFGTVKLGDINQLPFADDSFGLVLATDIIEHVDDDVGALREIARVLRPGQHVLVTVPAFPSLWGFQDEVSLHKRRYRMDPLLESVRAAGLEPGERFYFNYLLFAPIWAARQVMKVWKHSYRSESDVTGPVANRVLTAIFAFDVMTSPRLAPPFGVSILVVARKP
jgi:SAM-dependent methyltransferase